MKYRINKKCIFDAEDNLLSYEESGKQLTLSAISSRLFCELLKNRSGVTREYLLNVVWSEHGLTASNNNLNNHISLLRKHLEEVAGLDDLIKTVPKKGFALNRSHSIELLSDDDEQEKQIDKTHSIDKKRFFISVNRIVAIFLLCSLTLFAGLYGKKLYYTFLNTGPKSIYKYKGCVLKTLKDIPANKREASIAIVLETVRENNVDCENDSYDVFFYLSSEEPGKNEFKMFSWCRNGDSGSYYHCYSIKMV